MFQSLLVINSAQYIRLIQCVSIPSSRSLGTKTWGHQTWHDIIRWHQRCPPLPVRPNQVSLPPLAGRTAQSLGRLLQPDKDLIQLLFHRSGMVRLDHPNPAHPNRWLFWLPLLSFLVFSLLLSMNRFSRSLTAFILASMSFNLSKNWKENKYISLEKCPVYSCFFLGMQPLAGREGLFGPKWWIWRTKDRQITEEPRTKDGRIMNAGKTKDGCRTDEGQQWTS